MATRDTCGRAGTLGPSVGREQATTVLRGQRGPGTKPQIRAVWRTGRTGLTRAGRDVWIDHVRRTPLPTRPSATTAAAATDLRAGPDSKSCRGAKRMLARRRHPLPRAVLGQEWRNWRHRGRSRYNGGGAPRPGTGIALARPPHADKPWTHGHLRPHSATTSSARGRRTWPSLRSARTDGGEPAIATPLIRSPLATSPASSTRSVGSTRSPQASSLGSTSTPRPAGSPSRPSTPSGPSGRCGRPPRCWRWTWPPGACPSHSCPWPTSADPTSSSGSSR